MSSAQLPPKPIINARARLGEGPLWDSRRQQLHWVDIYNRRVHSWDLASGQDSFIELETVVSGLCLAPCQEELIVAQQHGLSALNLETGQTRSLVAIEADQPSHRLNDLKCDPRGRIWVGTMNSQGRPQASLYRFDPDGTLHPMATGLTISNGLGWSPDGTTFFHTDTPRRAIYAYAFDMDSGQISQRRVFVDLSAHSLFPDGLTVDAEGCVWSAMWNGQCVIRFDPAGQEVERIHLPVPLVTSCTFGGPELQDLFITTASVGLGEAELQQHLHAGDVFALPVSLKGLPSYSYGGSG